MDNFCNVAGNSAGTTTGIQVCNTSNAPMSTWIFGTIWVDVDDNNDTILDDYPDLIGLP